MKKVATLVILLAGILVSRAHDAYSITNTEGWSTTQSTASRSENSSYLDATGNQSVVVNWLLVCEDLCGAGFGGPICGKHCLSSTENANNTENEKYKSVNLCSVLCDFDLGGTQCDCGQTFSKLPRNARELCNAACQHFNISINGCSKCLPETRDSDYTTPGSIPSSFTDFNTNQTGSTTTSLKPSTANDPMMTTTSKPSSPRTTTPTTTTISSTTSTTTTPDWSAVCVELCKKGEGGALCNCDLPPLSRKRTEQNVDVQSSVQ